MAKRELKIVYHEIDLSRVIEYFVKGYERPPETYEYYVDPVKSRVIIRAYVPADAPLNAHGGPDEA